MVGIPNGYVKPGRSDKENSWGPGPILCGGTMLLLRWVIRCDREGGFRRSLFSGSRRRVVLISCSTLHWLKHTLRDPKLGKGFCGLRVARPWCLTKSHMWGWPKRWSLTPWSGPICRAATSWSALAAKDVFGSMDDGSDAVRVRHACLPPMWFAPSTRFRDNAGILLGSVTRPRPGEAHWGLPALRFWRHFHPMPFVMRSRV